MPKLRARDRLDRRLAARRLRARHVRAVARALARTSGVRVGAAQGRLDCRRVWVGRRRSVHFADPTPGASGDATQDVVALALDLRARGAERRAEQLLADYALAADDYDMLLAAALPTHTGRLVIATGGTVASGKSTLAKALSRHLAVPLVVADRVRDALLAPVPARVAHELGWDPDFVTQIYRGLLARAEPVLASGRSVVLDACFLRAEQRRAAAALAARHGARFVFVHCDPSPAAVFARLHRRDQRDGGGWVALARATRWEPIAGDEPGRHLRIDTDRSAARMMREFDRATQEPA